jgi:hypothetical protein
MDWDLFVSVMGIIIVMAFIFAEMEDRDHE